MVTKNKLMESALAPSIADTDENVVLNQIYMKLSLPSLARRIFGFTHIHGPTGGVFAIKSKDTGDGIELLRNDITVEDDVSNSVFITQEAFDDMANIFGEDVKERILTYMKRYANIDENKYCIEFLKKHSKQVPALTLSNPNDPEIIWKEIAYKATQLVLEANMTGRITFNSYLLIPYKYAAAIMAMFPMMYHQNEPIMDDMYAGSICGMSVYINPDIEDTNVYVGLRDKCYTNPVKQKMDMGRDGHEGGDGSDVVELDNEECELGKCAAIFTSYYDKIIGPVNDVKTGNGKYFIFKRFAITPNPLHTEDTPMMFRFEIN